MSLSFIADSMSCAAMTALARDEVQRFATTFHRSQSNREVHRVWPGAGDHPPPPMLRQQTCVPPPPGPLDTSPWGDAPPEHALQFNEATRQKFKQ